ncbi:MAG: hypothetical protein JWP63_2869, partial [Candidatus Solibacter sp.]|nr:hypothetical protein [Candidatus Solibacter sp.]
RVFTGGLLREDRGVAGTAGRGSGVPGCGVGSGEEESEDKYAWEAPKGDKEPSPHRSRDGDGAVVT